MKKQISHLMLATLSVGLFFSSCKKTETVAADAITEFQVQSDDQARFTNETDAAVNDANAAIENLGGSYAGESPLSPQLPFTCDASVTVDTANNSKTITITYSGANCFGNRTRTGVVVISFTPDFRWIRQGASYTVAFQNLKITRKSDGKYITINGNKTIKNVSGGKLRNLATRLSSIVHEVTSSAMSVTFDDGTMRNWQIAKRRTFTYNNGIVISVTGISALGGGIAEWGINRFDKSFTSAIIEPLVVKQSCDFRLVSGQIKHTGPVVTTITTFGLDATGVPVSVCPGGAFYYKVVWTGANGNAFTHIAAY